MSLFSSVPRPNLFSVKTVEKTSSPPPNAGSWHRRGYSTATQRTGRQTVLIADDDPDARTSLGELLELAGHDVHVCGDGQDAVRIARECHPDVVFLDIEMPGLDGYAVCHQLRSLDEFAQTRVYALSGLSGPAHERRCRLEGFTGQFVKPLEISALDRLM